MHNKIIGVTNILGWSMHQYMRDLDSGGYFYALFFIKIWHICLSCWKWLVLYVCVCYWNRFPDAEKLSPPILQLDEATFYYNKEKPIFNNVNLSTSMDSRICIVSQHFHFSWTSTLLFIVYVDAELMKLLLCLIIRTVCRLSR